MGRLVPAVTRAFDILELFLQGDGTLSAPEITRRLGLPRTTTHELVSTLAARHYLVAVPERPGRYRLGVRTYQLGSRYAERLDLAAEGREVARGTAAACGETVRVALLEDAHVIHVATVDSTHAVRMVAAAGRRLPAHCTAAGKMLLAGLPADERDGLLGELLDGLPGELADGRRLIGMTPWSVTDPDALRAALDGIAALGVAVERRESHPDVCCVAAPVRDRSGRVVAALSVSVPVIRWDEAREGELTALAVRGAGELSARLGHRGPVR
ncbi:IclR family transcriptional regulator [Streptomyces omiyaensis]|uniref:IclR family transcriptional regulator n=1 Tax=Streptomyces omiyaensis TaxID=68247 RepID=A0ABW7BZ45_9ACTN|nr:IclR family transcriptional regulator [Streptomyces omiyaensis]GGY64697.1 transcriptional regulator [Streptomyces omiyaensis]